MNSFVSLSLKTVILFIGTSVLLASIFLLPSLADQAATINPEYAYLKFPILVGIYLTTIPFFFALYHLIRLIDFKEQNDGLYSPTINSLIKIKISAVTIGSLYIIGSIFLITQNALHPGIALIGLVVVLICTGMTLLFNFLQKMMTKTLELKTENELTI